jgi:hypothetical protein
MLRMRGAMPQLLIRLNGVLLNCTQGECNFDVYPDDGDGRER